MLERAGGHRSPVTLEWKRSVKWDMCLVELPTLLQPDFQVRICETDQNTVSRHASGAIQPEIACDSFPGRRKSNIMVRGLTDARRSLEVSQGDALSRETVGHGHKA